MAFLKRIKRGARRVRRALGLSPLQSVLRKLRRSGTDLSKVRALEVFGCNGDGHVKDYANLVSKLEVWDISVGHEHDLRRNLPRAHVRICDSYRELQMPSQKYDLIIIDNSPVFPPHIEHFDLFPDALNAAAPRVAFILNIIPQINRSVRRFYPSMLNPEVLKRRKAFYGTEDGEDIPLHQMTTTYERMFRARGFVLDRCFTQRRNKMVLYLALMAHSQDADGRAESNLS